MEKQDKKGIDNRRGSQASLQTLPPPPYGTTSSNGDAEVARLKQELEIERLKAELAGLKGAVRPDQAAKPRKGRQQSYSSSSSSSSGSYSCSDSSCSGDTAKKPGVTQPFAAFGRPAGSALADMESRMHGGKVQGAKWKIIDITTGGVSCDKGVIAFNEFFFSDCKNTIRQYQPVTHLREKKRLAAQPENDRKRKAFLETYTHIEFQTLFRHPELISEPKKKHYHQHHRHGHRQGSGREKTVHTLPYDPFNPFSGPRPGGF